MSAYRSTLGAWWLIAVVAGCDSQASTIVAAAPSDAWRNETPTQVRVDDCDPRLFGAEVADAGVKGPGDTYDYVLDRVIIDEPAEPPTARGFYGFNLDGRSSPEVANLQQNADCSSGDYLSVVDPDQNEVTCGDSVPGGGRGCRGGVDNQLPSFIGLIQLGEAFGHLGTGQTSQPRLNVSGFINQQIDAGRYAALIRVAGVHGTLGSSLNDPSVVIRVYPVARPAFQDCGSLERPGQEYAVDDTSLRERGNVQAPVLEYPGCILRGRLRQRTSGLTRAATPMFLPLADGVRVPLRDLHLRIDLTEDGGVRGNLGGVVLTSDLELALATFYRGPELVPPNWGSLANAFADLPGPFQDDLWSCWNGVGAMSVGLGFTALRANVQPTTVSGPIPGACGSP